jgi:hypothetical protein
MKARGEFARGFIRAEAWRENSSGETKKGTRAQSRRSVQSELDDAAQDEHEQRGGNGHIHRIAHSFTLPRRCEVPIVIT